ncbi:response regulator [Ensifer sp. B1-9]|uniref:response regulator n=1 Tax=Ensifer sp. B1-9 TaxID=3141455 RepID=UPI003D25F5FA
MPRVLIVEDDPIVAIELELLANQLGYFVVGIARSFDSARIFASRADIALVDMDLADGATGPRVAQYLSDEFGVSVVMVTGDAEALQDGVLGAIGVVSKPATSKTIENLLHFLKALRNETPVAPPFELKLFSRS